MAYKDFTSFNITMEVSPKRKEGPNIFLRCVGDVLPVLEYMFSDLDREHFVVLMLGADSSLLGVNTVSIGAVTKSLVHPREVFKPAILANAQAIVLAHNHPYGSLEPSEEDVKTTEVIKNAGQILGINLIDHMIWSYDGCYSFAEHTDNWDQ